MKVQRMFVGSVALLAAMVLALGSTGWRPTTQTIQKVTNRTFRSGLKNLPTF